MKDVFGVSCFASGASPAGTRNTKYGSKLTTDYDYLLTCNEDYSVLAP